MKNKILYMFQKFVNIYNYVFSVGLKEKKLYQQHIHDGANIFDVGSNVGSYINAISSLADNIILNIHAFEANEDLSILNPRILKSNLHNVKLNNIAISSKVGTETIYINSISSQSSMDKKSKKLGKIVKEIKIDSTTLDFYCNENNIDCIDLLKIDVEGMEIEVLKSAKQLLSEGKIKIIKIEISTKNFYEALDYLNNYGFLFLGITNQTYINNKIVLADYFFIKN